MSSPATADSGWIRAMPAVFVLIWSTGFIVARYGMPHAPPMSFLAVRYALSILCFLPWIVIAGVKWPADRRQALHLAVTGVLAGLMPGVAVGLVVAIVAQLTRTDGRASLVPSLAAVVTLVLFAASASAWIGAARTSPGREAVTIAGVAIVCALASWIVVGPRVIPSVFSVLAGAAGGAVVALNVDGASTWPFAAVVGAIVAGFAMVMLFVGETWMAGVGRTQSAACWGFTGALAFALTGPLAYVAAQMVGVPL